ncbi:DNA polymerase zeta [Apophysomyces ossiformis]|uniref:DNA polymerase n=1 Tax=Apophysomyces ossiformis TaxID=679940 RepID=A0A8H7BXU4_9FUNG|nr:DNA polymerase zeta [Apophysomyces ossiformis]
MLGNPTRQCAYIGLGAMGAPISGHIADHLEESGYPPLLVYNRTKAKAIDVQKSHKVIVAESVEACARSDIIFSCLFDDKAVEETIDKLLRANLRPGTIFVDQSTISPTTATRICEKTAAANVHYVASPILGPPSKAASADLTVLIAGSFSARSVVIPLLIPVIGKKHVEIGDDPSDSLRLKLCGNMLFSGILLSLTESLTLAEASGLSQDRFQELVQLLFPNSLFSLYSDKMIKQTYYSQIDFPISGAQKDVGHMVSLAKSVRTPAIVAETFLQHLTKVRDQKGDIDITGVIENHYLAEPGPLDRHFCPFGEALLRKVPVIRIFGSTPGGQKACMHVHQVYPYFFVPYTLESEDSDQILHDIYQFGLSLNQALSLAQGKTTTINDGQYIAAIMLVKGVPFYGYYAGYQTFLKIYLLNPGDKKHAMDILQSGAVMATSYQPYEAHIPFELQFMMDYNLYGMDWVHVAEEGGDMTLKFRKPLMEEPKAKYLSQSYSYSADHPLYTAETVSPDRQSEQERSSYCELELDITVGSILNRRSLKERDIHTVIGKESKLDIDHEKLVSSLATIWMDERKRRESRGDPPISSQRIPEERMPDNTWSNEADLRAMIQNMIEREANLSAEVQKTFPNVVTAFHAVDALYRSAEQPDGNEQNAFPSSSCDIRKDRYKYSALEDKFILSKVMATPSRYRDLAETIMTQVDRHIINSPSFLENEISEQQEELLAMLEEEDGKRQLENEDEQEGEEEKEISQWIKEPSLHEPSSLQRPHLTVNYDHDSDYDHEEPLFRPRKLDFDTEIARQEQISRSHVQPVRGLDDTFFNDLGVSEIPPSPSNRAKRRRANIPQYDGAVDDDNHLGESGDISVPDLEKLRKSLKRAWTGKSENEEQEKLRRLKLSIHVENNSRIANTLEEYYSSLDNDCDSDTERKEEDDIQSSSKNIGSLSQTSNYRGYGTPLSSYCVYEPEQLRHINHPMPEASLNADISEEPKYSTDILQRSSELDGLDDYTRSNLERRNTASSNEETPAYFTRSIQEMWSPIAEDREKRDSFYVKPPVPLSPTEEHKCIRDPGQQRTPPMNKSRKYIYNQAPPTVAKPAATYQEPYYSNPKDVPSFSKTTSGKGLKVLSKSAQHLQKQDENAGIETAIDQNLWKTSRIKTWSLAEQPPTVREVNEWLKESTGEREKKRINRQSQLDASYLTNSYDFRYSLSKPKAKTTRIRDYLELFSLEIHASNGFQEGYHVGIIATHDIDISKVGIHDVDITYVENEENLIHTLIDKVRLYDPDLLVGYELHNSSWGYVIERGEVYDINVINDLSRVSISANTINYDQWGFRKASVFRVTGRHMMNIWRLMRSEIDLTSYTFENIAYHVLHHRYWIRMPHYSQDILTKWYTAGPAVSRYRLFRYYLDRVQMNLDILDVSEVVNRTSESARVFGVDFYSVITRGSQFKVESVMFRIAKPENYMLITPSRKQVGQQRAIECLPMIMEPASQFYSSPLLVLDFQSLYPSIMIAFSTCLGKVRAPGDSTKFGIGNLDLPEGLLGVLKDYLTVSPNGIIYVKTSIREGVLGRMLTEVLDTRVMVKSSMKNYQDDKGLLRKLDARQLTLKYIANVTYGYTSATYSGRMPAVEIADSIVETGRKTLEKAIKVIEQTEKWGAKVVYGDTDSVFVYLPGKTRDEAFAIGDEIAATVTKMNPAPVKLKFEKVYHPCVLLAKKRYVGFKYEKPTDETPEFEAKGIETVRRDGTPATQKILKACLKILFKTQDMSELKQYLYQQWTKILSNRVPLRDFIIAKEVRLGSYSTQGLPHGAQVALAKMSIDPRTEPQYGERVPYVVVYRGPNAKLKEKVVRPEALLWNT